MMQTLLSLALLSGISANAIFFFGLGLKELASGSRTGIVSSLPVLIGIAACTLVTWPLFSYVIGPLAGAYLVPLLLFPVCSLLCFGIAKLLGRNRKGRWSISDRRSLSAFDGLAFISAWLALKYATSFPELLVLCGGSLLAFFCTSLLLSGIRERASIESVPRFMRGAPLFLLACGLLALITGALGALLANALKGIGG